MEKDINDGPEMGDNEVNEVNEENEDETTAIIVKLLEAFQHEMNCSAILSDEYKARLMSTVTLVAEKCYGVGYTNALNSKVQELEN